MKAEIEKDRKRLDQVEKDLATATKERADIRKQLQAQGEKIDAQEKRVSELEKKGDARDEEIARLRAEIEEINRLLGRKPVPEN
jgi:septal ring factor EnvC (AmiA/AmiB activator)